VRGAIAGALALIALQAVLGTEGASGRVTGLLGDVAGLIARFADPNTPGIADRRRSAAPAPAASSGLASSSPLSTIPLAT
jgi:hypothetical protein